MVGRTAAATPWAAGFFALAAASSSPVSQTGLIDRDGKLVYIIQSTNLRFVKTKKTIGLHDGLPYGAPIVLNITK